MLIDGVRVVFASQPSRAGRSLARSNLSQIIRDDMDQSLVVGATGVVGGYIVQRLVRNGERPLALSRSAHDASATVDWCHGDLAEPDTLRIPPFKTLYCTVDASLLAAALPYIFTPSLARVIVFTSTSILTKIDSEIPEERELLQRLAAAEQDLMTMCKQLGVGWTILRPTIIYAEGRDENITRLARLIKKLGFLPLAGKGAGLRQPVHAEDLAIAAVAAASSPHAINKIYALPGKDTMPYREMVGRIFDGLRRPRRIISMPHFLWRAAFTLAKPFFPKANVAMGSRMDKDLIFDSAPAIRDFNWSPRPFRPRFD